MPYAFYGHCWVHFFSQAKRPKWRNIEAQKAKMKKNDQKAKMEGTGTQKVKMKGNEARSDPGPHGLIKCVCVCVTPLALRYDI